MKRQFSAQGGLIILFLVLVIILAGCASKRIPVDVLSDDGKYHYYNDSLGFEIAFPEEFQYYQVQRVDNDGFSDVEYFVPTTDYDYPLDFSNFAKAITIRVLDKDFWQENKENYNQAYQVIGENRKKVYAIRFWDKQPSDWQGKWGSPVEEEIINSLKIN